MSGAGFHLAQINVGRLLKPLEDPALRPFVEALDPINALAEAAPGFVWRLTGKGENATDVQAFDDPSMLINMSVWTDVASLGAYVYRSDHLSIMRRRREFFETPTEAIMALWWIPAGTIPTPAKGVERLMRLRRHGPTESAFTFRQPFAPTAKAPGVSPVLDECA